MANEKTITLVGNLIVSVSEWKGKKRPSIRVYYEDAGELKPGKNGINMTPEQWADLKAHWDEIRDLFDSALAPETPISEMEVVERDNTFEESAINIATSEC